MVLSVPPLRPERQGVRTTVVARRKVVGRHQHSPDDARGVGYH